MLFSGVLMKMSYSMHDETGNVTDVFVHEPGLEAKIAIEAEDPCMWLFDPSLKGVSGDEWLAQAQKEHKEFVQQLEEQGVKVHYLVDLLNEPSVNAQLHQQLASAVKQAHDSHLISTAEALNFFALVNKDPASTALQGISLNFERYKKLEQAGLSILIPKPNAYFAQDPFAIVGDCFVELKPATWQRSGEPDLWKTALQPHQSQYVRLETIAEGGDITVWDGKVWVGIGTRTTEESVKEFADWTAPLSVVAVYKPDSRAQLGSNHSPELPYIHLDTIMMPLSETGVLANAELLEDCAVPTANGGFTTLASFLDGKKLVPISSQEQYSLAANVLPVNGVIVSAKQNAKTNTALVGAGYQVRTFDANALLGGSGAAHCMTNAAVSKGGG